MAGRGPAPKPSDQRVRRNAEAQGMRVVEIEPTDQPDLPEFDVQVKVDGELQSVAFEWPARTREWWRMWSESPLSEEFTDTDWSELLDTARIHASFWQGNLSAAGELRLRVAKFGATPEDRARLRIQFAAAEEADDKRKRSVSGDRSGSRGRRGPLKAV